MNPVPEAPITEPNLEDPIEHVEVLDHENDDCGGIRKCRICWLDQRTKEIDGGPSAA